MSFGHQPSGLGAWCGGGDTGRLKIVSHPLLLSQGAYLEEGEGDLWAGADLGLDKESKRSCNLFCEAVCGRSGVAGALFRRRGRPLAGAGACACKSSYVLLLGESFRPTLTSTGPYFLVFLLNSTTALSVSTTSEAPLPNVASGRGFGRWCGAEEGLPALGSLSKMPHGLASRFILSDCCFCRSASAANRSSTFPKGLSFAIIRNAADLGLLVRS